MVASEQHEPLLLYIAIVLDVISMVLVVEHLDSMPSQNTRASTLGTQPHLGLH